MLTLSNVGKRFAGGDGKNADAVRAIADSSFTVEDGQFFTLLGPSGCGKTTTLRCVAGLENPDSGEIRVDDRLVYSSVQSVNIPASDRGFGMVFQSYAIWPHMDVYHNVSFPLDVRRRRHRPSRREISNRVERALEVVELGGLADRPATALSGGQQQRLALARALVMEPPILLLDEPLSNLDAKLRENMRLELRRLQRDVGITTLYVTHDQEEALALSNVITVMERGEVLQIGTPRDVYSQPINRTVAAFIGRMNFMEGRVRDRVDKNVCTVETGPGAFRVAHDGHLAVGAAVVIGIRPDTMHFASPERDPQASLTNRVSGQVVETVFLGEISDYLVSAGDQVFSLRGTNVPAHRVGDAVELTFDPASCVVLDA